MIKIFCIVFITIITTLAYAGQFDQIGREIFESALKNVDWSEKNGITPSTDLIFANFKRNSESFANDCVFTTEQLIFFYNNMRISQEPLSEIDRQNLLGILVCAESSQNRIILASSDGYRKFINAVVESHSAPTGFNFPPKNKKELYRELTWRILLNHYLWRTTPDDIIDENEFASMMLLQFVNSAIEYKEFSGEKKWLEEIYSDLVIRFVQEFKPESNLTWSFSIQQAVERDLENHDFMFARNILYRIRGRNFLSDKLYDELSTKLYFKEKFITYPLGSSFEWVVLAIGRPSMTRSVIILALIYLFGCLLIAKDFRWLDSLHMRISSMLEARQRLRSILAIIFHPVTFYFVDGQKPLNKIVQTVFIFLALVIIHHLVPLVESHVVENIYLFP